jgi:hypothetical protein
MRGIVERRRHLTAPSECKDGSSSGTSTASGELLYFCRGEFGMWHWLVSDDGAGAMIVSREAFSNIYDCERDAIRFRKHLRRRIAV